MRGIKRVELSWVVSRSERKDRVTWELVLMLFNVLEYVEVGVGDDESFTEDVDDSSDVEVLRTVVGRRLRQAPRPRHAATVQVLAALESGIADRRLVDGQRVVWEAVDEDEPSTAFLLSRVLLASPTYLFSI